MVRDDAPDSIKEEPLPRKNNRKKSPEKALKPKKETKTLKPNREAKIVEGQNLNNQRPIKDKSSAPAVSKSPMKPSPRRRRKNKSRTINPEGAISTHADVKPSGSFDTNHLAVEKKSDTIMQRQDTVAMSEKIKEIVDDEKAKMLQVKALLKVDDNRKRCPLKFDVETLKKDDMVAIKVAEKHFIPGQPCLGKVVSLPDATGLVTVHYYSGNYEGAWRPMMSRSSPYLRRVPASVIVYKFNLTEENRMTPETIQALNAAINGEGSC